MHKRAYFDHCRQVIESQNVYKELGERGFSTFPADEEFSSSGPWRIKFQKHFLGGSELEYQYLEFMPKVVSSSEADFLPHFSIGFDKGLQNIFRENPRIMSAYESRYEQKAYLYDGRDFLCDTITFNKNLVLNVKFSAIEYCDLKPHRNFQLQHCHDNTVDQISGFLFNTSEAVLTELRHLVGHTIEPQGVRLKDGTQMIAADEKLQEMFSDKTHGFYAIVCTCREWSTFLNRSKPDEVFIWQNRKAGRLKLPNSGWDIIVRES